MFEYKIIRKDTFECLEPAINEATKDGWQLHGEVQAIHKDMEGVRMATDHYYWIAVMYRMPPYKSCDQALISYVKGEREYPTEEDKQEYLDGVLARKESDGADDSSRDA